MRIPRTVICLVTVAALLMAGGGSSFCLSGSQGVMACCRPSHSCDTGMKAADCCRFVPAAPAQAPPGVATSFASSASREEVRAAILAEPDGIALAPLQDPHLTSPSPLHWRDPSVPLYLLNTSLLR
jgi:hypothetical protein